MVRGPRPSRKGTGGGRRGDADSGAEETRTPDVLLAKEVLYQLSYGPKRSAFWAAGAARERRERACVRHGPAGEAGSRLQRGSPDEPVWAFLDSNQRPLPYQGSALTS